MISSHTASVAGNEFLPFRRPLMGKAGAAGADAPSKKDLLAALGQTSEGDVVGATDKASKALSQVDGAAESSAVRDFASAVAPFLSNGRQDDAAWSENGGGEGDAFPLSAAGAVRAQGDDNGDGQVSATEWGKLNRQAGGNTVSTDLSAGRLNSQMLSVLLQQQQAA